MGALDWSLEVLIEPLALDPENEVNWEQLAEAAQRGEEKADQLLVAVLGEAMIRRGFRAVAVPEADSTKDSAGPISKSLGFLIVWGLGISMASFLGLPLLIWPLGMVPVLLALAVLANATAESPAAYLLVALLWLVIGVLELAYGEFRTYAIAYLGPLLVFAIFAIATRSLRLQDAQDAALAIGGVVRAGPLIAPVVLLFLFLPALSADVWQVATDLELPSFIAAAALSVGLVLVVVRLQMGSQVQAVLSQRSAHLSDDAKRAEQTRSQATSSLSEEGRGILESIKDGELDAAWPSSGEEYAPYLSAAEGSALQAPLTGRLIVTVAIVGLLLTAYIYALCSVVVSADTVQAWTHGAIPATNFLGLSVPGGPYLKVASLLGIAATATFLSFALIEDRFAAALTNALLRDPADRFLVLALPYVSLRDRAISASIKNDSTYQGSDGPEPGGGS